MKSMVLLSNVFSERSRKRSALAYGERMGYIRVTIKQNKASTHPSEEDSDILPAFGFDLAVVGYAEGGQGARHQERVKDDLDAL